jgi:hypothetical protein
LNFSPEAVHHAFARGSGSARVPALAQQADKRTQSFFSDKLA